ncbi:MAG: mechanosensitive ion channel family protein [Vicingaceae bacterium]
MNFQETFDTIYLGNKVGDYLLGVLFLFGGLLLRRPLSGLIVRIFIQVFRRSEYKLEYQTYRDHLKKPLNFLLFLVFLFLAVSHLEYPESWNLAPVEEFGVRKITLRIYQLLWVVAITRVVLKLVVIGGEMFMKRADQTVSKQDDQLIPFAVEVIKILIIVVALLVTASTVFKINVGSLVAGLGIGGLAIALAAKESLENLFGSFTIFFDKPFVVDDLVTVAGVTGTVIKVGFRSTRLRTLEKSYVTIPNKRMIDAELDNLTLRTFRRVKFDVGLTYGTNMDEIKSIVSEIQNYIDEHPHTNQEGNVRFMEFGSSSLNVMVLYYIDTMDWDTYLKIKEEVNYKIMEIVEKSKSDFAFPTQTIHLNQHKD